MFKKEIIAVLISIFFIITLTGCTNVNNEENNTYSTLYVDDDGGADYIKIQDAINNIDVGGTIYVRNGTYDEIIKIDKTINLIGDIHNKVKISKKFFDESISINGIVTISADNCKFIGFDLSYGYFLSGLRGIYVSSSNNTINYCNVTNINIGIFLDITGKNNEILNCSVLDTKKGIYINRSVNNSISNNRIINTGQYGMYIYGSDGNILSYNMIVDNDIGMRVQGSENNLFFNNTLKNNSIGLKFCCGSKENVVYNNNFIENYIYNAIDETSNHWDNGIIGNYWDDYVENYPDAKQIGDIWDTPYELICVDGTRCGDIVDGYPVVNLVDG